MMLMQAGAHDLLGSKHLTSAPAILKDLETRPRQLMLLDELGDLVRGLKDVSGHKAEIPRYFKSLFSGTDRSEYKNYADGKAILVKWHHFSFYGTSTPESFWENMNYSDVTGGFLARTLILESGHEAPMPKVPDFQIPEALVKAVKDLHQLSPLTDGNIGRPLPHT